MYNGEKRVKMSPITMETVVLPLYKVEYLQSTVVVRGSSRGWGQLSLKDRALMPVQLGDGYWYGSVCRRLISLSIGGRSSDGEGLQMKNRPYRPPGDYNWKGSRLVVVQGPNRMRLY